MTPESRNLYLTKLLPVIHIVSTVDSGHLERSDDGPLLDSADKSFNETNETPQCSIIEKFVRDQDEIAVKWQERNQDREIREDLTRKIKERDKQIRDRKIAGIKREAPDITIINLDSTPNLVTPIEENNILAGNSNNNNNNSRKNALPPDLPTSTAKPAKIPRLNSFIAPLPVVNNSNSIYPCKGILQTFEISPSFFTTKPSSKLGLVLHKAEVEGREYQQRVTPKLQQTNEMLINIAQCSIIEKFVCDQDEIAVKWQECNQDSELREDLTRKIKERDKQISDRTESLF
uniref:Uncharacterized protein n=1 Tax=Meloidogyne hapla TaxID=6305 RepID=A0A1I8AY06_MELHA